MGERGMVPGDPRAKESGARKGQSPATTNVNPLAVKGDVPPAPKGVSRRTRQIWDAFWESTVSGAVDWNSDRQALERWAWYVNRWHQIFRELDNGDTVVTGSQGQDVLNPLSTELHRLEGAIGKLEKDLGLTPMARTRLGLTNLEGQLVAAQLNEMVKVGGNESHPQVVDITIYEDEEGT